MNLDVAPRQHASAGVRPAVLWELMPDGAVRCVACAHRCLVRPGRRGICGVRENRDGSLVTLVHGQAVAAAVDPVEKKPFHHVAPGTTAYSIATRGCNFHCRFCQNWNISQADRLGLRPPARELPPAEVVGSAVRSGSASVAYTYVEPTIFVEYVADTARMAHDAGLLNLLVTNGYQTPEALDLLATLIDAANVDLKGFSDAFYRRVCGGRLAPVLDAVVGMRGRGWWVEVTTLLVPDANDDPAELRSLARWLVTELGPDTPWHVSRFFPAYRMTDVPPTPLATIRTAVRIGQDAGLRYVYAGNVEGIEGAEDTRCASCGTTLIERRGLRLVADHLVAGACPSCGRPLPGLRLGAASLEPPAGRCG